MATDEKKDTDLLQEEEAVESSSSTSSDSASISEEEKLEDGAKLSKKRARSSSDSDSESEHPKNFVVDQDSETYNMNHKRRGKALIFNHKKFDPILKLSERVGTDIDVKNLQSTLSNFGFEVIVKNDLRRNKIFKVIQHTANENHADADCLLVIVLTHGQQGFVSAKDCQYETKHLWDPFTSEKCPTLAGKPKLFLVQACQGDKYERGTQMINSHENQYTDNSPDNLSYTIPINADFLVAYSTKFEFVSWRNPQDGTWFIQSFCKVMDKYGATDDLLYNMTRVVRMVAISKQTIDRDRIEFHGLKQIPYITTMLTRSVIFTPKK